MKDKLKQIQQKALSAFQDATESHHRMQMMSDAFLPN